MSGVKVGALLSWGRCSWRGYFARHGTYVDGVSTLFVGDTLKELPFELLMHQNFMLCTDHPDHVEGILQ